MLGEKDSPTLTHLNVVLHCFNKFQKYVYWPGRLQAHMHNVIKC